ncbi:bifunctional adenosylcobinamide kinase/adenosylcobinamide-phosphate guanylyltransferase [Pararhodobacter sp.]|uniref:bifunctional adenosylcobinamide kinase/adenosylcobinamide-phosphate guanylyltransferase n=1 Tax=Pararhodobacter sp. TaxID=2127056 RepID=UPI002AFE9E00|nr:bifunctional adenosylcobinamide kinase/adenosylcobinamide-phosphate guanylyltransferase [Pararhodobacter sp.]
MSDDGFTLVLGGARSGKSAVAERLLRHSAAGRAPTYIATAEAWDDEMRARIKDHQTARDGQGWHTLEAPLDLATTLGALPADTPVLIDCLTLWLTNHLLAESDLTDQSRALGAAIAARTAPIVAVANEVGLGIVPDNALARRFRDAAGRLNQDLAAQATRVVFVAAGLPIALKGTL